MPYGVAIAGDGQVYMADILNARVIWPSQDMTKCMSPTFTYRIQVFESDGTCARGAKLLVTDSLSGS